MYTGNDRLLGLARNQEQIVEKRKKMLRKIATWAEKWCRFFLECVSQKLLQFLSPIRTCSILRLTLETHVNNQNKQL